MAEENGVPDDSNEDSQEGVDSLRDLRNLDFPKLRKEGWEPRIKRKRNGLEYITLRGRIKDEDGKKHNTDRSFGRFTEERWNYINQFFKEQAEEKLGTNSESDAMGTEELSEVEERSTTTELETEGAEGIKERDIQLSEKGSKMFKTVVSRHGAIPPSVTYASDIVMYFETFLALGYKGTINDWMHEIVRDYLAEHNCKMHIEMGTVIGDMSD